MKRFIVAVVLGAMLSGCAVLLPYEQEFSCTLKSGAGLCGSVSDVYRETVEVKR